MWAIRWIYRIPWSHDAVSGRLHESMSTSDIGSESLVPRYLYFLKNVRDNWCPRCLFWHIFSTRALRCALPCVFFIFFDGIALCAGSTRTSHLEIHSSYDFLKHLGQCPRCFFGGGCTEIEHRGLPESQRSPEIISSMILTQSAVSGAVGDQPCRFKSKKQVGHVPEVSITLKTADMGAQTSLNAGMCWVLEYIENYAISTPLDLNNMDFSNIFRKLLGHCPICFWL